MKCMERVLCRPCMNSAYVCIIMHELEWAWSCYWCSMQYVCMIKVVISPSSYMWCQKNTLQWQCRLCIDLRALNVWNGCHVGRGRTGRTFVAIAACAIVLTRSCYWCLMQQYETYVILPTSCSIFPSKYTTYVSSWTNSTYVCIDVYAFDFIWGGYCLVFNSVWRRM